jgi:hypothetical protein
MILMSELIHIKKKKLFCLETSESKYMFVLIENEVRKMFSSCQRFIFILHKMRFMLLIIYLLHT